MTAPEENTTETTPEPKPPLKTRLVLGTLRFGCFVGVGAMLFGLRTPFGALLFIALWASFDRALPTKLRRGAMVGALALFAFTAYVVRFDNNINFGVMEIEAYVADTIQPNGSTKLKAHVFPLQLHEITHVNGFQHMQLDGPFEIWLELKDKEVSADELQVVNAVIVSPDGELPIEFERAEPPKPAQGWTPYRPVMKPGDHISFWKQRGAVDLSRLGPELTLKFSIKHGDTEQQARTTLAQSKAIDSGLIDPEAWQRD